MTTPQERFEAFLMAERILQGIVKAYVQKTKRGTAFPEEDLVLAAKEVLRYYPSPLEIERAADERRSMQIWMAREVRNAEQVDDVFGRLQEAVAHMNAKTAQDQLALDCDAYMNKWLYTRHPALRYREPAVFLDVSSNLEMFAQLCQAETIALREARRVFGSDDAAYRWLRKFNRRLFSIPLAILDSDFGRREVMSELGRLALYSKLAR
jgi:Protein of unknown function (DUF2384)